MTVRICLLYVSIYIVFRSELSIQIAVCTGDTTGKSAWAVEITSGLRYIPVCIHWRNRDIRPKAISRNIAPFWLCLVNALTPAKGEACWFQAHESRAGDEP